MLPKPRFLPKSLRKRERWIVCIVGTLFFVFLLQNIVYYINNNLRPISTVVYMNEPMIQLFGSQRIILLWTDAYEDPTWWGLAERKLSCDCFITRDRGLLKYAKIIVFHWRNTDMSDLPVKYKGQVWIWHHIESPTYTRRPSVLASFQRHIDCWASYRADSDFPLQYGKIISLPETNDTSQYQKKVPFSRKKKSIAWMVSHCGALSRRDDYTKELSKYIQVDIYGACGDHTCDISESDYCYHYLEENYKYYLAFENSICNEYFTEKIINILNLHMIPIVFGGADYESLLPNHSYIDALKFQSPRHLASFLNTLAQDEARYDSYFDWKKGFKAVLRIPDQYESVFCDICGKLSSSKKPYCNRTNQDMVKWWFDGGQCKTWELKLGLTPL